MDDPPWDATRIATCATQGPHPSTILHHEFLRDEFAEFIDAVFWVVLPLEQIQSLQKKLRLSPMAIKVKHNRRPRVFITPGLE